MTTCSARNSRTGLTLAALASVVLCAKQAAATTLYDSYSQGNQAPNGYLGASFITHYGEQVTLAGPDGSYLIDSLTVLGVAWSSVAAGPQDVYLDFYTGANLSSSATSVLGNAINLGYEAFSLSPPAAPTAGSFIPYTLNFATPLIVPSNTFTVVISLTNAAANASSSSISGIVSTGTPDVGTNPGFVWLDSTAFGDFSGSEQYYGYNIAMAIDAVSSTSYQWNSSSGGNWEDSSKWSPMGVPTSSDIAVFNLSSNPVTAPGYTVTLNSPKDAANSLTVESDRVTLALSSTNSAALNISGALTVGQPAVFSPLKSTYGFLTLAQAGTGGQVNVSTGSVAVGVVGGFGQLTIGSNVRLLNSGMVTVAGGSSLLIQPGGLLNTAGLTLAGSTDAWTGKVDLTTGTLDLPAGSLTTVTNQVKEGFNYVGGANWNGSGGITSSTAAADNSHLTALGVIQNNQSGTAIYSAANPFFGRTPLPGDILVAYTYFGDANLDGKVDGSDYSLIDNGYASNQTGFTGAVLSGWYNGDFNYDGVIDGSDYALIDNAYNNQTTLATSADEVLSTSQVAAAAVPEPAFLSIILLATIISLQRSRHQRRTSARQSIGAVLEL
jgi:hypothetical protein